MKKLLLLLFLSLTGFAFTQELDWAVQLGGLQKQEPLDITTDNQGNVYSVGWFEGTVDFDPGADEFNLTSNGTRDIFISKLDSSGNFVWAQSMGATGFDQAYSIYIDTAGNIFLTGWYSNTVDFDTGAGISNITSVGGLDAFILKLDTNGDFVWVKGLGGSSTDIGYSVISDDNGVYISGRFQNTVDFDPGAGEFNLAANGLIDVFTLKLSPVGDFIWVKQFGTLGTNIGEAVALDASGNVYTLARFNDTVDFDPGSGTANITSFGADDVAIVKLDNNGDFIWVRQMGGPGSEEPAEMVIDQSGNIYTTGYFSNTADFDPSANQELLSAQGSFDVFVSKLNANGDFLWAKKLGGTGANDGKGIDVDNSGNIYLSGIYNGVLDVDPSASEMLLPSYGSDDAYAVKLNSNGDLIWATHFGDTNSDLGRAVVVDKTTEDAYFAGNFQDTITFDDTNSFTLTSLGQSDVFVAKISESSLSLYETAKNAFQLYPNPAETIITIKTNSAKVNAIEILDTTGRIVKRYNYIQSNEKHQLNISYLKTGCYFIKIKTESGFKIFRFLKK